MISRKRLNEAYKKQKKRINYYFYDYIFIDSTHAYKEKSDEIIELSPFVYRSTGSPCSCWMCAWHKWSNEKTIKERKFLLKLQDEY